MSGHHVVFPGNIQGRHVRETGPKGACLVTVDEGEVINLANLELDVVRWAVLNVDVTAARNTVDIVDLMRDALDTGCARSGRTIVSCSHRTAGLVAQLHSQLVASANDLTAEARSAALGLGDEVAWAERVAVQTTPAADAMVSG